MTPGFLALVSGKMDLTFPNMGRRVAGQVEKEG